MLFLKFLLYLPVLAAAALDSPPHPVPIFTAIAQKIVYPHSQYNVSIFIEPTTGDKKTHVELEAEINSTTGEIIASAKISLLPGQNQVLPILINELPTSGPGRMSNELTLKIRCKALNNTERYVSIFANKKEVSILIQSDKSIYKPGETVKFRVILLDRNLKLLVKDQLTEIRITDVSRNLIKKWDDLSIHSGFYKDQLQLASEPLLGDWKIEVKLKKNGGSEEPQDIKIIQKTLSFRIEEYVLPKYVVSVQLPKFLSFQDLTVPVRVEAKYTYGKPVEGTCTLRVRRQNYGFKQKDDGIFKTFPVNGVGLIDININELFTDLNKNEQNILFEANVTEEVTGKSLQGSSSVRIYKLPYKIQRLSQSESLMPGLPYTATFKVSTQDDVPIPDPSPDALKVSHSFAYDKEEASFNSSIPETGLVFMKFRVPTNTLLQPGSIEITYKELTQKFSLPSFNTGSKVLMQIQLLPSWYKANNSIFTDVPVNDPVYVVNSKLRVNVNATEPFLKLNYLIHRGHKLLASDQVQLKEPKKEYDLEIRCPENAEPGARIVVYMVLNGTEEILAKSLKFMAVRGENSRDDANFLNVAVSKAELQPGEKITLKLKSTKGSLVALRGVDQSVLLLKGDKDITEKTLEDEAIDQEKVSIPQSWNRGTSESFRAFDDGGLVILSNAKIEQPGREVRKAIGQLRIGSGASMRMEMSGGPVTLAAMPSGVLMPASGMENSIESQQIQIRTRTLFSESWLWEEVSLNESSNFDLVKTVPDTITSWIISGYSLNPSTGVGILAPTQKFTTFRPFFISLDLPYSVVKGEVLLLKVLVHNYLPGEKEVTADITIKNEKGEFEFAGIKISKKEQTVPITLKPNSVTAIKIAVIPQIMGLIMLNVIGKTRTAGDALIQPLRVIPPGSIQRGSAAVLLDPVIKKKGTLNAVLPEKRIKGADKLKLTLISNILGTTISNLDKLLVLPTGCGEQNMMGFTVDTVLLNYFNSSKSKVDTSITAKATSYLETGYQRQLKYKHSDGSYSIWGGGDSRGSTWLTAFVIRSFIQARKFVTIDENLIEKGLKFLGMQQNSDGGINENTGNSHNSLGESRSSVVSLSAFTLLTFMEARKNWVRDTQLEKFDAAASLLTMDLTIEKILKFITSKALISNFDDMFGLILTSYAATLADHPKEDALFEKVLKLARHEQGMTYWESEKKSSMHYTSPISVEMTSYVLLSYMARGQTEDALPVIRWLLNQRSSYGGFLSTQDTVVGLAALAEFAKRTNTKDVDLQVVYKEGDSEKSVGIDQQNKDVLQEFELANITRAVDVAASGKGSVLAQLSWTYYVEDDDKSPAFAVKVNAAETSSNDLSLNICTQYVTGPHSSMAIIEVNLPSGYIFDVDSLQQLKNDVPDYKRHELENRNTKLAIYVEKVSWFNTCFPVLANKLFKVGKLETSYVSVYDYYDTTKSGRTFYQPPVVSFCDICKDSQSCNEITCLKSN